jgi:hypothetical protein
MKTVMFILAALMLLPGIIRADSPLTSISFSDAYLDVPIIRQAKDAGVLNQRFADYLSSPLVEIGYKAALCNALGWRLEGKENAKFYRQFLARQLTAHLRPLTSDEYFCLGYLTALDNYFEPQKALPLLEVARKGNTHSFTLAIVYALVSAQAAFDSDWTQVWRATRRVELDRRLEPDMRPEAVRIIFDYLNLYHEDAGEASPPGKPEEEENMMPTSKGPFCQSCGMSRDYCNYCYQKGAFTDPSMTYEKMLAFDTGFLAKEMKMPEPEAKKFVESWLPHLKRWKKQ